MTNKRNLVLIGLLSAILLLTVTSYVGGILIDTDSYKLRTPLPLCDYYVGQYSNSTYFVLNGSNWDNELRTTVFETCISSIMSWGGGDIKLGSGDFECSTLGLDITQPSWLHGSGVSQTTITTDGSLNDDLIEIDFDADYTTISDLTLDGTGQGASYHGINAGDPDSGTLSGLWLQNLDITDCGDDGIHLGDGTTGGYDQLTGKMNTLRISGNGGDGIDMNYDPTDWEMFDLLISGHTGTGDAGIRANSDNVRFWGSHLWGNYYEMVFADEQHVTGWMVTGVGIMDGGGIGRHRVYHPAGYNLRDISFSGGQCWVAKLNGAGQEWDGFHFTGTAYTISIDGMIFLGGYYEGVDWVQDSNYAINWDADTDNSTLSSCTFRGFNQSNPISTSGSYIDSDHHSYYNNG